MFFRLLEYFTRFWFKHHTFTYDNTRLHYFFHSYNCWGWKERTIEIPIIRHLLDTHQHLQCMEIGNVTKHYYDMFRDVDRVVIDRDEKAYDVINQDIIDINPGCRYDFIYSISTFEHMPDEVRLRNLQHVYNNLLMKGGLFVFTFPIRDEPDRGVSREYLQGILVAFPNHIVSYYQCNGCICVVEVRK